MISLEARTADGHVRTFRVPDGRVVTIGRSSDNTVVLQDASVSRHHAELVPENGHVILHDRGSFNGTFLDGHRVLPSTSASILGNARLHIGRFELLLEQIEDPTETVVMVDGATPRTLILDDGTESNPSNATRPAALPRAVTGSLSDVDRLVHRLRVLEHVSCAIKCGLSIEQLHALVLDLAVESVLGQRGALFVAAENGVPTCVAYAGDAAFGKLRIQRSLLSRVLSLRECVLHPANPLDLDGTPIPTDWSVMVVPLVGEGCFIGALYVDSQRDVREFDEEDLRVLQGVGRIASERIDNALLLADHHEKFRRDEELSSAAAVQRRLMPKEAMTAVGYASAAINIPCYEVGGDFFDYLELAPNRHGVVLADVAGKGLDAAMLLMGVLAYGRAWAHLRDSSVGLASFINQGMLSYAPSNRFVSFFLADFDVTSHRMTWCNAGHAPSPFLVRATGQVERLEPSGLPLGILPDSDYPASSVEMEAGDLVVACSDGVIDAASTDGELFGDERLVALVKTVVGKTPAEAKQQILETVREHTTSARQTDDLTIVVVGRLGSDLQSSITP